jgi:hypothetical protein
MNYRTEKFVNKIPGWLETNEGRFLEKISRITKSLKGDIVEIGSFCGKSTIYLAQSGSNVYAIDPHKGNIGEEKNYASTYKEFIRNLKSANVIDTVTPLVTTSLHASKNWRKPIRILFIDGLHDEKNATQDFNVWTPYLINDGIVAIHDSFCRWCGSEKIAVNNIVRSKQFYKIGVVGSIIYGVKGKGTYLQRLNKFFLECYIIFRIELNHFIISLTDVSVLKTKMRQVIYS